MIVAAHAGTGKTTLAKLYPDWVIDFVAMPYKYHLHHSENAEPEKSKAGYSIFDIQEDWPKNYVEAIKQTINCGKIILIPSDSGVLSLLNQENIPYILCYPTRESKEAYRQRYMDRGNTDEFLSIFIDGWDMFLDRLEGSHYGNKIVMQPHQYLSDVLDIKSIVRS
jgi:hypothetical protein